MAWFHCQFCDLLRELSDEHIGKPAKCPNCKKRGTVVGARDGGLPTIGRGVDDHEEPQSISPSDTASSGQFWNQFAEPNPSPTVASSTANTEPDEIDDWQNDESASSPTSKTPTPPNTTNSTSLRNRFGNVFDRGLKWSPQNSGGRVFESYITVSYLRSLWKLAFTIVVAIWLIGSVGGIVGGIGWIFESTGEKETLGTYIGFAILKTILVVIGFGLFTIVCLLELFVARMSLETIAVFFDIAHDIRRLADGYSTPEPTPSPATPPP